MATLLELSNVAVLTVWAPEHPSVMIVESAESMNNVIWLSDFSTPDRQVSRSEMLTPWANRPACAVRNVAVAAARSDCACCQSFSAALWPR